LGQKAETECHELGFGNRTAVGEGLNLYGGGLGVVGETQKKGGYGAGF